jgi:multiple sugar transport system substrate-binding protein
MSRQESFQLHYVTRDGRPSLRVSVTLVLFVFALVGASCSPSQRMATPPLVSTVTPRPTSTSSISEPASAAQPAHTPFDPTMPVTLTIWLPPDMALSAQTDGQAFQVINQSFHNASPTVMLEIVPKAAHGAGGLVNSLVATRPVVPSRLPDVVAIDTAEVRELVARGIIVPLDDLVPASVWQDLYPSVAENVSMDGQHFAIPFQVDISFLAYNTSNIQISPRTWTDVEGSGARYVFPASQGDGSAADAFLLQYLAEGGQLFTEGGRPYLDSSIMAAILKVYQHVVESGVVPIAVRNLQTLEDCWSAYMQDKATMTNVGSWQYQREKSSLRRTGYAAIPTASGVASTLARSWSWAIVTDDPIRQKIASRYVLSTLGPQALSSWCVESFHLPAHRTVLALTVEDEPYRTFLEEQLQRAYPYPDLTYYTRLQTIIIGAIADVLDGVSTPERAAVTAAAMAARLR